MESLIELCDLIVENPGQFQERIAWLCNRCPSAESLSSGSPRVSRSQLHAVLAVARFLCKCPNFESNAVKSVLLSFYRSIPASFNSNYWPQAFSSDAIYSFFNEFLGYILKATEQSPDFGKSVAGCTGEIVIQTINSNPKSSVSRIFLNALCSNFPPIVQSDVNKLIPALLDRFQIVVPGTQSSSQSSHNHSSSADFSQDIGMNGSDLQSNGNLSSAGLNDVDGNGVTGPANSKQAVKLFEEESLESLEKQEIAFKLMANVLSKVDIDPKLMEQARAIAKNQLRLMLSFLKIRQRDWSEQGQSLKVRIDRKLSVYNAASRLHIKTLAALDTEGKTSKRLLHGALALLMEAAEGCLFSAWRKLRACEELFGCLLSGISQAAVIRGGQLLRVLLIRFKPLVLSTCAQADTWAKSQGSMFESVLKTCCEIVDFGWAKDRSPIDTFIMGLATSIRERNDYGEEEGKERQATPPVQLNVIRLLADLNVSINKPEVVDMILPLFIESLEEGEASTPGLLRLRLLDAVSRLASLGFDKSYREAVVLMTRSYLGKLTGVTSEERDAPLSESSTERVETLPAGFLLIARGIKDNKLHSEYRHRLLSLCSDVGLAAESKSGR